MSKRVQIIVDGVEMQYEDTASLPLSFSLSTDSYLEIVGVEGLTIGNDLEQIVFPGTKTNRTALGDPQHFGKISSNVRESLPMKVIINGALVFDGNCLTRSVVYQKDEVSGITTEVFGGGLEFFQQIDGVMLSDLPLGAISYNQSIIEQSWYGTYLGGWPGVFAPVVYRELSSVSGTNTYTWDHYRFHVYFSAIIQAIAELTGVTFQSQLFGTEFFQKHVYLFGVGDAWKTGKDLNGYFYVGGNAVNGFSSWSPAPFTTESPAPFSDSQDVFSVNTFTAPQENVYNFSGSLANGQNIEARFVTSTGFIQPLSLNQPFQFSNIAMGDGDTARIELREIGSGGPSFLDDGSVFTGQGANKPVLGGSIDIASCLHDKEIKEFLRGISHQFCLAWSYDSGSKTVYVDPRHDFNVDSLKPGFYHDPVNSATDDKPIDWTQRLDQGTGVVASFIAPYGDSLTLRNKPEASDLYEQAEAQNSNPDVEYLSAKFPFANSTQGSEVNENPFWEELLLIRDVFALNAMPIVCPNYDPDDGLPEEGTFKSNPKYAYYEGVSFSHLWQPEGQLATMNRPLLYQRPMMGGIAEPEVCASYADFRYNTWEKQGYASKFYPQFYQILFDGLTIEGDVNLTNPEFELFPVEFRRLCKIKVGKETILCIRLRIDEFQPLDDQMTTMLFLRWSQPRADVIQKIIHSSQDSAVQIST